MCADTEGNADTPLRLVTLFRDNEVYTEPENPKLATWKLDLDKRLLELEEAAAVRISSQCQCKMMKRLLGIKAVTINSCALKPGLVFC